MTAKLSHLTIDCANAYELSEWWKRVLAYDDVAGDPNEPGHEECAIVSPDGGHTLLFLQVEDFDTSIAKRIHLDLRPTEADRDDEIETVRALGATEVANHRGIYGPGTGWVVFADPEGNQFCILRSDREIAAQA